MIMINGIYTIQNIYIHICIHIQLAYVSLFPSINAFDTQPHLCIISRQKQASICPHLGYLSLLVFFSSPFFLISIFHLLLNHLFLFLLHHSLPSHSSSSLSSVSSSSSREKESLNRGGQNLVYFLLFLCNSFLLHLSPLNHGFLIPFPHSIFKPEQSHKLCWTECPYSYSSYHSSAYPSYDVD